MNIFILEERVKYEGDYFVGAFSSKEKALQYVETLMDKRFEGRDVTVDTLFYLREDMRNDYIVTEYKVDGDFILPESVE